MATVLIKNLGVQQLKKSQPVALFSGDPIEITNAWQDISEPINCKGAKSVILWVKYDVNSSVDTQIRALAGDSVSNCIYSFPLETVGTIKVDITDESIEMADEDLNFIRQFILDGSVNFIKFQVKDSADGTGQIDTLKLSVGR